MRQTNLIIGTNYLNGVDWIRLFCSVIKNNYELQNDGTMKNILSKRTFIVLPLFLFHFIRFGDRKVTLK